MRFLDELREHAAAMPGKAALIEPGGEVVTFGELARRMGQIACAVRSAGIGRDGVVALIMPDGAGLITAFLGTARVAECAVVNPGLRGPEIGAALAELGARAVILDPRAGRHAAEAVRVSGVSVLDISRAVDFLLPEPAGGGEVALLLHTSATTGKARIVPLTHANLRAMAENTLRTLELSAADRFLSMMPQFHLQGLLSAVIQLLAGGSVVSTAGFDAGAFLAWVTEYRPTWYTAGPTLHNAILPLVESHPEVLEKAPLRFVRSIGARLPQALMERLESALKAPVLEGYGSTEAGAVTSNTPLHRRAGSTGRSTGSEIGILGEDGALLPAECEGEIVVRGAAVMHAYRNNPEANRSAFHDGWFRTGDLGRMDEEGFLFVTGRIKEMINRGGEKVLPGEIENALAAHPAVAEAVAFGVPHATLGEDVMAAVVLRPGAAAGEAELRGFAAARIADFKLPRRIVPTSGISKGATGKPDRAALAAWLRAELETRRDGPAASTEIETRLTALWKKVLRTESVGTRDHFFQLGGDSLAFALMMAEVELEFGSEEESEFLATPTIETLARVAARRAGRRVERTPLVALQPHGSRTPFFCIPGADENPYYFLDLAKALGDDRPFLIVRDPRPLEERGIYTVEEHAGRFCAAIRSRRPEGPYLLGGHCYGGILSFEVARQLAASGGEIALLALFEVPTPGYPKVARHWRKYLKHSAALAGSLVRGEARTVWMQAREHAAVLRRVFGSRRQALARRVLVGAGGQTVIQSMEQIHTRNQSAGRAYVPGRLDCEVVHFLSADEEHSTRILDDPRLGWREMVGARFSTCDVPGIADGIFKPPHVSTLAALLRERLDRATARG